LTFLDTANFYPPTKLPIWSTCRVSTNVRFARLRNDMHVAVVSIERTENIRWGLGFNNFFLFYLI